MRRVFVIMVVGLTLLTPRLVEGEIYKWVDEKGTIHFSEDPGPAPEKQVSEDTKPIPEKQSSEVSKPVAEKRFSEDPKPTAQKQAEKTKVTSTKGSTVSEDPGPTLKKQTKDLPRGLGWSIWGNHSITKVDEVMMYYGYTYYYRNPKPDYLKVVLEITAVQINPRV